jgi:hypothetical protein
MVLVALNLGWFTLRSFDKLRIRANGTFVPRVGIFIPLVLSLSKDGLAVLSRFLARQKVLRKGLQNTTRFVHADFFSGI